MWEPETSAAGLPILEALAGSQGTGRMLYGAGLSAISEYIDNALDAYIGTPFSTEEDITVNFDELLDTTGNVE